MNWRTYSVTVTATLAAVLSGCAPLALSPLTSGPATVPKPVTNPLATLRGGNGVLTVTTVSIGAGLCIIIACPNGNKIVNDCGSTHSSGMADSGTALASQIIGNTGRLYVVTSHKDSDHVKLIKSVVGSRRPDVILFGGKLDQYNSDYQDWVADMKSQGTSVQSPKINLGSPSTLVSCAAPGAPASDGFYVLSVNAGKTANDQSLVTKVVNATYFSITTMGDAEEMTEEAIMATYAKTFPYVPATVLNAAHHGSENKTNTDIWAKAVAPNMVIFSAAAGSHHGHPRCSSEANYAGTVYAPVDPHAFTCYDTKTTTTVTPNLTKATYNTADSGAVGVVVNGTNWRPFRCPGNNLSLCTFDTPSPAQVLPAANNAAGL